MRKRNDWCENQVTEMEKFGIFVEFRVEGCDLRFEQGAVLEIGRNKK